MRTLRTSSLRRNARTLTLSALSLIAGADLARAGIGVWTSRGPDGGGVVSLAIDPTHRDTLYAGTVIGGVFKSTDGGASWHAINNGLTDQFIGVVAVDPNAPGTVYVNTSGSGYLFKSTDGGDSWRVVTVSTEYISNLTIAATTPSTLFVAVGGGVLKSTDGGATWSRGDTGLVNAGFPLAVDPSAPGTLYAGGGRVFRTTDAGNSWNAVSMPLDQMTRNQIDVLAVDPNTPSTLYAGTEFAGVFKSADCGRTWRAVNNGLPGCGVGHECFARALAIDADTPGTLYVDVLAMVDGQLTAEGVFKSTDGADSWDELGSRLPDHDVPALAVDPATGTLYAGTEFAGVFKSPDGGATWHYASGNLSATWVTAIAVDPTFGTLYAGTSVNGLFASHDGGSSWESTTLSGDYGVDALAIAPPLPDTFGAGTGFAGVHAFDRTPGMFRSSDRGAGEGGIIWTPTNLNAAVTVLVIDPRTPTTAYAGTDGNGVLKTVDDGFTWNTATNTGLSGARTVSLVIDPSVPTTLYAGTDHGIFKSTDGGGSWSASTGADATGVIAIDPAGTLFAGTSEGLSKSTDGASSWSLVSWQVRNVAALVVDPNTPTTLYAAADGGVLRSTDGGTTWGPYKSGLSFAFVDSLAADPTRPGMLYAGTVGGGVFSIQSTAAAACIGDCDDDGRVTVDELLTLVKIALDGGDAAACRPGDVVQDGRIYVDEIMLAVHVALAGCPR